MAAETPRGAPDLAAEIAKYREVLAADPRSRAFALLAEALRKSGQFEEAARVAQEGLKVYPFYLSGRVALARAWFDGNRRDEARQEFEKVIAAAPDNLLAHRHLAEIYIQSGDMRSASRSLKMVVLLDPRDERAREQLDGISSPPRAAAPPETASLLETHRFDGPPAEIQPELTIEPPEDIGDERFAEAPREPEAWTTDAVAAPELEPEAWTSEAVASPEPERPTPGGTEPLAAAQPEAEEPVAPEAGYSTSEEGTWSIEAPTPGEGFPAFQETPAAPREPSPAAPTLLDQLMSQQEDEPAPFAPEPAPALRDNLSQEPAFEEIADEFGEAAEPTGELSTETLADIYVQQGFYDKALDIYSRLLAGQPGNPLLRQKVEELRGLLSLARPQPPSPPTPTTATIPAEPGPVPSAAAAPMRGVALSQREAEALSTLREWLARARVEPR